MEPLKWPEHRLEPSEAEVRWRRIPLLGWAICNFFLEPRRLDRAVEYVNQQLRCRSGPSAPDDETRDVFSTLCSIIKGRMEWTNGNFSVSDPLDIVLGGGDWVDASRVFMDIEETWNIHISKDEEKALSGSCLRDLLDFVCSKTRKEKKPFSDSANR